MKTTNSLDLEATVDVIMEELWGKSLPRHLARLEVERALLMYAYHELEAAEERMKMIFAKSEEKTA